MKKHFTRALALLLALVMVLSVMPVLSFATEEGEEAVLIDGMPGDQTYGVIYNANSFVMGFDLEDGKAPAKPVTLSTDENKISSLPNGTAIIQFIKADSDADYYLTVGGKYLTCKDLDDKNKEKLVLTDTVEPGSKWTIVADQAGAAGYFNIKNAEYKWDGSTDVYLEEYTNKAGVSTFSAYSYNSKNPGLFQMKFYSSSPDEDGRVGQPTETGALPVDGKTYVVYNAAAKAVMGQPTGADVAAPALLAAAAVVTDGKIAYEDVADGGLIFTVHTGKDGDTEYYTFESNGKYLAMPENTVASDGSTNNDETLLLIEEPAADKIGYIRWTLSDIKQGYVMYNMAARYGKSKCCVEFFDDVFSGWTYKSGSPELFAMNFYPMEDKDGQGYVVNPTVLIGEADPAIGEDCTVSFTINDVSEPTEVRAEYQFTYKNTILSDVLPVNPTMEGRKGSFTIYDYYLEKAAKLTIRVIVTDALGKTYQAEKTFDVRDEPLILSCTPAANSATGEEKRPEISVTFANVNANPSFQMLVDDAEVSPAVSGDKLSYTPAADLAAGRHSVSVTITRTDGKSVNKRWIFFVGEGGETLYFGQIHSHTSEYSDGAGSLEDAYEHAHGVDDMDFLIVTDHSNYFDSTSTAATSSYYDLSSLTKNAANTTTKWEEARATAKAYNELYDDMICAYGYEMTWSGGPGHTNSFNTYGVISRNNKDLNNKTGYGGMHLYNDLMVNAEKGLDVAGNEAKITRDGAEVTGVNATKNIPFDENGNPIPVVSQFNHPGKTFGNFDNFAGYSAKRDDVLNLIEVGNGEGKVGGSSYFPSYEQYDLCLSMGWHVAPTNNQDNHKGNWGDSNSCRDVILTDDFSEAGLYRALDARRVYATEDQNLRISYELTANGETYQLGDIAPLSEEDQPEKLTIKLDIQDPDRSDNIYTVEVIGEGGKTLKKIEVNAASFQDEFELANTDSYYYIKVVEADGQIAVTAPVWVKEAVPVAADLETSASVAAQGEEETVKATLTNGSESEALTLKSYKIEAEGRVLEEKTGLTETVAAGSSKVLSVPFTPSRTDPSAKKTYDITVTFDVVYKGKALSYTKTITETSYPPEQMTYIGLDNGHKNFYVSGDYANNEGSFLRICAERGIICQYIEAGQMTKENLAKYKAVVLTVPRIDDATKPPVWTADELAALADYASKGGNIINLSKSDRYDYEDLVDGVDTYNYASASMSNLVNEAVGAQTRFVRGIVVDNEEKANEAYRINFSGRDLVGAHDFTQGIFLSSNGKYQWYNGTGITYDPCARFIDIDRDAWYHGFVDYALEHGIMVGTDTNTFGPTETLTREQFITILWRVAGSPTPTVDNPFRDVDDSNYCYTPVCWAYEFGVTAGVGDGLFDRSSPVTREQIAQFLFKLAALKGMDVSAQADLSAFPDADSTSEYAVVAVKWAVANGLIAGDRIDDTTVLLKPQGIATRAVGATMLMRFVEKSGDPLPKAAGAVRYLIAPYDSSWVASYKANFTGSSYEPNYEKDTVMAAKGSFGLVTAEQLPGGGFLVCAGACFISNFDLKYGTPSNEQYENYGLVCNILDYLKDGKFDGEITPIAQVHQGEVGQEYTVEGWITSNASDYDKDTAFFDCIYVQDETRGINCFPVSGYYYIGEKVRVHGGVTYYCGEIELNLGTDYNGSIQVISNDLNVLAPAAVSCKEAMSDDNIGNLMKVTGTITDIHRTAGIIDKIYVDDGSGEQAMFFINAYIQKDSTVLDAAEIGMQIEGVGIGSRDVDEESGGADGGGNVDDPSLYIKRLRVRSREELAVWGSVLDTAELEAAIAEALALERDLYTPESLAAVDEALAAAQAVMADENKTQRQVTEACTALRAALDALERKTTHDLYAPVASPKDGDVVVIYNPGNARAVKNGNYKDWYVLAGEVTMTEDQGMIQDPGADLLWTVSVDADGNYSFSNGENKIVMWLSESNGKSYAEVTNNADYEGADPLWTLIPAADSEGQFFIQSKTIANGEKKGYLECYQKTVDGEKDFYMTGYFDANPSVKNYGFRFYAQVNPGYYPANRLAEGDEVVIYNPGNARAVKNGNYKDWYVLAGEVTMTEDQGMIQDPGADLLWTVSVDADGNYSFSNGENKIVMWLSESNGKSYAEVTNNADYEGADPLWTLIPAADSEGQFFIQSKTIANGEKKGYLECYQKTVDGEKDFYMTGYFDANPSVKNYGFRFYKFGYGPEAAEEPVEPAVDKAALTKAITDAQALAEADYTVESWADLQTALAAAIAVRDNDDATQAQVDEALSALNAAVHALVSVAAAEADVYELVTEAPEDWSGTYLIAAVSGDVTYVFNGNEEVNGFVSATVTDNRITFAEGMAPVVIAAMEGGYSLHVSNGYMYGDPDKNCLSFSNDAKLAVIGMQEDGTVEIVSNTATLRFNSSSNQLRFRFYKPNSGSSFPLVQLYRLAAKN